MDGILILDKPKDYTSRDCVNKVNKILNIKKTGHTGTLDPLATGVLVICINKATKLVEFLSTDNKQYVCEIVLGIQTTTADITGEVVKDIDVLKISEDEIDDVLKKMVRKHKQTPPMYSAVKYKGKELYKYARAGITIEDLPEREIEIFNINRTSDVVYKDNKVYFSFCIDVSKGTYIRTVCTNIAESLNTIGCMTELRRTKSGNFSIEQAISFEDIDISNLKLMPLRDSINFEEIIVDDYLFNKIKNGSKLEDRYNKEYISFIYDNKLVAVYQKHTDGKVKPKKVLV